MGTVNYNELGDNEVIELASLKLNIDNPREISAENLNKLKNSIKDFDKMFEKRPIVIDENNVVLGGNMRLRALADLGYTKIPRTWISIAKGWTEAEKREFVIKDNNSFGQYDWEALANGWDDLPLSDWGVDLPEEWVAEDSNVTDIGEDLETSFKIEVQCSDENEQEATFNKLTEMGYKCQVLTL